MTTYLTPLPATYRPAAAAGGAATVPESAPVTVYGNRWCGITQMTRRLLDRAGVPYPTSTSTSTPRPSGGCAGWPVATCATPS